MPDATHHQKICIKCGLDCSDRPRVKDANGNYACKDCVQPQSAYDLVETQPKVNERPMPREEAQTCAICTRPYSAGAVSCVYCGFDPSVGLQPHTGIGRERLGKKGLTCAGCSYDLTGLPSLRCPECGTVAKLKSSRDFDREMSAHVTRWAYLTPLLMLAIGGLILFVTLSLQYDPATATAHFLSYVVQVPIGILVFFVCCLVWIGFDAPLHLTALRLAAVYCVVDVTIVLTDLIPVPGMVMMALWILPLLLYVYLLAELLDLDTQDAFVVAIATAVTKYAVFSVIAYAGYGWF